MKNQYEQNDPRSERQQGNGRHGDYPSPMQRMSDDREDSSRHGRSADDDMQRGASRDAWNRDVSAGNWDRSGFQGRSGGSNYRWQDDAQVRYGGDGYGEGQQGYYGGQHGRFGYYSQGMHEPGDGQDYQGHGDGHRGFSAQGSRWQHPEQGPGGYGPGHSMGGLARYDQQYNPSSGSGRGPGGYRDYNMRRSGRHGMERGNTHQGPWGFSGEYGGYESGPGHRSDAGPGYGLGFGSDWRHGDEHYGGMSGPRHAGGGYGSSHQGSQGYRGNEGDMGWQSRGQGGFRGVGPRGYTRSDERLCEDINERLTDDDHVDASDISIKVKDGEVTLTGEVRERRLKHYIEDLVERCHGVREIRNQISVSRSHGRRQDSTSSGNNGDGDSDTAGSGSSGGQGMRKK